MKMQLIPPKGNTIIITLVTHFGKQKATNSIVAFYGGYLFNQHN